MSDADLESRMAAFQAVIQTRDVGAAEDVLHEDYALCIVQPTHAVFPRAEWITMLPEYIQHELAVQERQVDVAGDVAVVLHRVVQRATVLGKPRDGVFVITDIWLREDGVWRVWKRHSTPLEAGAMPT